MSEEEETGRRDTCDEVDIESNSSSSSSSSSIKTDTIRAVRLREDDDMDINPITLDMGFFSDFSVDGCLWDVWDRIDSLGFVYIHQASGRPLAVVKTLDRNTDQLNGYCFWFQIIHGKVEEISYSLSKSGDIKSFLAQLDQEYNTLGSWLNDIEDDRVGDEKLVTNTEKEDEIEHMILYRQFLDGIGVSIVEKKILVAKRQLNTTGGGGGGGGGGDEENMLLEDSNK